MRKRICFMLASCLLFSGFAGCGKTSEKPKNTGSDATTVTTAPAETEPADIHAAAKEALDGKKVIFFGNSHSYYSKCVLDKGQNTGLAGRNNDQGLFYQFCKANGITVDVTNYTFGVHQLSDFYTGSCAAGKHDGYDHMANFGGNFNYDYVILQQGTKEDHDLVAAVESMTEPFKQANPDVKVIFMMHQLPYTRNYGWVDQVAKLKDIGVTVVNWGGMLHGILQGTETVPGTQQTFNANSFIISKSASDGYHPNLLVGYITALMTYCTITGEKAEGQPWKFPNNPVIGEAAIKAYRTSHYTYDKDTNFDAVLLTKEEMQGFQKLIDQYMAK